MSDLKKEEIQKCKICSAPTATKCSSCKLVSYCNKEHQKEDWKNHKDECKSFQIKSSLELGRFLEASRKISCGEVIFTELPIVVGPRSANIVCLGCCDPMPKERCPQCSWPICSTSCEGLVSPEYHGAECVIFQNYFKKVPCISDDFFKYEAILPLRCLLLQYRNPEGWKSLLEMEGHIKKRGPNTEVYKQVQEKVVKYLIENFLKTPVFLDKDSKTETKLLSDNLPETLQKICGILDVNALEIRLENGGIANGLYRISSLMEHNCLSNTKHIFYKQHSKKFRISVLANQEIQPGSHISTMYTHALWGTQQRQEHLRSTKYFTCRCKRCGDPTELGTNISALRCLAPTENHKICGGTQLPIAPLDSATEWKCDKCPISLTSAQVADLVGMIGEEVNHVLEQKPTVENLQTLLDKLRKLLHKNHYLCYSVSHSLIQLYGRQPGYLNEELSNCMIQKKIKICKELLKNTFLIDPTCSRLALYSSVIEQELSSALLILGKRKIWSGNELLENLKEAKKHLVHALESLFVEDLPEKKMAQIISSNLEELDVFCKISHISL